MGMLLDHKQYMPSGLCIVAVWVRHAIKEISYHGCSHFLLVVG